MSTFVATMTPLARTLLLTPLLLALTGARAPDKDDKDAGPVLRPVARGQTEPVPTSGDAADDPAIWVHPTDPARSLILGTDKQASLMVYDLDGKLLQVVSKGCKPNNVDVVTGVTFAGKPTDLAVAGTRSSRARGVKVWSIDPESRQLTDLTPGGALPVFNAGEPYGICTYRSRKTGHAYVIVGDRRGRIEQHRLEEDPARPGSPRLVLVRSARVSSAVEGLVADDELGNLFVGEEDVGVWKLNAEPDAGDAMTLIARVGEHGLKADVEGLAIYAAPGGRGYLIVSSQGNDTFKLYDRAGDHAFVATIDPAKSKQIDDVSDTDGIAVTSRATSDRYPGGLFVVQDGSTPARRQNFKLYAWSDIAGDVLLIAPDTPAR